jgi:AraC-like DNA-binding protein
MKAFHENRSYRSSFPYSSIIIDNMDFLAHWHNDLEFMYVCEGSIRMGINSESRILNKGDMAICSSGDIHYYDSKGSESTILLVIFNPQLIGFPAGWPKDIRFSNPFVISNSQVDDESTTEFLSRASELMHQLNHEYEAEGPHYEMFITGMLYELCGLILRHANYAPTDQKKDKRRITHMKVMQKVLDYLESNYTNPITLEDAARQANMSLFHFSRFFRSTTGMSYTSYLGHIRVKKAEELILNTDRPIIDIALDCGFTNVRTFNRVFKQYRKCAPSHLR